MLGRYLFILSFLLFSVWTVTGQDLSGTWEGTLLSGGFHHDVRKPQIVTGVPLSKGGDLILGG